MTVPGASPFSEGGWGASSLIFSEDSFVRSQIFRLVLKKGITLLRVPLCKREY